MLFILKKYDFKTNNNCIDVNLMYTKGNLMYGLTMAFSYCIGYSYKLWTVAIMLPKCARKLKVAYNLFLMLV